MQVLCSSRHKFFFLSVALASALGLSGCEVMRDHPPAPVMQLGTHIDSQYGSMLAQKNDTVWKISQRYNLPLRDIIDLNGLEPPYALAAGQRIKLPAPREHRAGTQDTLHSLARMYRVPVSQLVKMNGLKPPYLLQIGQVVRLPSSTETRQEAPMPSDTYVAQEPLPPENTSIAAVELPPPGRESAKPAETQVATANVKVPPALIAKPAPASPPPQVILGSKRPDFTWPVRGKVLSSYGSKPDGLFNDGINIAAPKGTPVAAAADGIVAYVGNDLASYGNLVLIRHSGGMVTAYSHMNNIAVTRDAVVRKGQAIGTVGSTGNVANSQLHFEIRKGTQTLDPKKFL